MISEVPRLTPQGHGLFLDAGYVISRQHDMQPGLAVGREALGPAAYGQFGRLVTGDLLDGVDLERLAMWGAVGLPFVEQPRSDVRAFIEFGCELDEAVNPDDERRLATEVG